MANNSLTQYIELYLEHEAQVNSNSAQVLNDLRPRALEELTGTSLPHTDTEGYERTSISDMFAPDYGVNIMRMNLPVDVAASFRCDVPNMSTLLGVVVNDSFRPAATLDQRLPQGVIFGSLCKNAVLHPDIVKQHYGTLAPLTNPSVALNTLMCQDGVILYVPKGVKLEKPLQLVNIFSSPTALAAFRRLLIVLEDDAEARLLTCDHVQDNEQQYLASQVIEVIMGRNSTFDLYDIEDSSLSTRRHSMLFASQSDGSNLLVNGMTLECGTTRNDYNIMLPGSHTETTLAGMAIASDKQHVDNNSQVTHIGNSGHSTQLFKYVIDDEASGAFEGGILVTPGAQFTEAYQSNRNILASTSAKMHTKPQLEIYNDDVKCSHGATTGQLDSEALFYMRSRGIPKHEARVMLMQAFMTDVIDTVRIPGLRERLQYLVDKRFQGGLRQCGTCGASCHDNNTKKQ